MVMTGKQTLVTINYSHEKENTLLTIEYCGHERKTDSRDYKLWP